uniref:F-box domain-containing protein n=1 Tax=Quercus lobata TaxID=97700 RepID=A0A7N2KT94_QUELO
MEDLCDNLLDDILFRLPLKSVVTCKSISKRFNTFISDPGFEAKLFLRYSCIFHSSHDWTEFYFKVPLYPPNSDKETESSVTLPRCFKLLAYCSGLLLLRLSKKKKCNDILAFHVKKREARIIELPRNLPLPFLNWTSWFGVVNGLLTIISTSREEISVWILSDYKNVEWVLKTRITNILNSEWSIRIPSFYDGKRLIMLQRKLGEDGEVGMYDIATDKWRKIGMSCRALDRNRAFVPFVPSLAEIKTRMWPDVPTPVVQSIDNLSLLVSFKGSDSA